MSVTSKGSGSDSGSNSTRPARHSRTESVSSGHSNGSTKRPTVKRSNSNDSNSSAASSSRGSTRGKKKDRPSTHAAVIVKASSKKAAQASQEMTDVEEEAMFVRILDLLERQDEFNSISAAASEIGDDDDESEMSSISSELTDEDDDPMMNGDPRLHDWELEAAWADLKQRQMPKIPACTKVLRSVIAVLGAEKNVVHLSAPEPGSRIIVVGDLHGHFADLMHILDEHGEPQAGPGGVRYIFNGDFVDRGKWGPEVLLALYVLKLIHPMAVFLSRGNHEDAQQNLKADNGFVHSHCTRAWGVEATKMYRLCRKSFHQLPLCHIVANEIFVVHGGLPLDPMITLEDINSIDRKRDVPVKQTKVLNYPANQKVKVKKTLQSEDGQEIWPGRVGRIIEVGNHGHAVVEFKSGHSCEEAFVKIRGAPELEDELSIEYDTKAEREYQKRNRLFVAMMWSDPVSGSNRAGPSRRGAGSLFDEKVTQQFLQLNNMRLCLRSHEKRKNGFEEEQRHKDNGSLISATIFSASNYPSGAGEPNGNQAAVVVLSAPAKGQTVSDTLTGTAGWREPYDDADDYAAVGMNVKMRKSIIAVEQAKSDKDRVSARVRALAKLKELVYCARPKLLAYWQRIDVNGVGQVTKADWSSAMRSCVIPDDDFPWEQLVPYMLKTLEPAKWHGKFNYAVYLAQYDNALSRKLASRWHFTMMKSLAAQGIKTESQARTAWDKIDRNGDGKLSYQEIRPLLRHDAKSRLKLAEEDRIYSLLAMMDKDKTGYVDKEEFVQTIVHAMATKPELENWGDDEVAQVWAASQAAIRALSGTTGCAASVFQVLDGDSDGTIDRMEFLEGLTQLLSGSPLLKTLNQWEPLLWKMIDEDGSGLVSPAELNFAFSVREVLSI